MKRLLFAAMAAALAASIGYAQSNGNVTIHVNKTAATSGKQMFLNYCASCHGVSGQGNGVVADALKTPPADLTMLSKNNNGQFPDKHIDAILQFGVNLPSHGSAEMPVWGPLLGNMDPYNAQMRQLRVSNLVRYLKSIQVQ